MSARSARAVWIGKAACFGDMREGDRVGLLSDIWDVVNGRTSADASKLAYGRVERVSGWDAYDPAPVQPGTAYFQWWLQEMWLKVEREWLSHYFPLAYSVVTLRFGDDDIELPSSLGEFSLGAGQDFSNLRDALLLNYEMTPPLPYNGGTVELAAAMVGVRSQEGLREIVGAVGELGKVLMVPQLSAVAAVAGPIAKTLDTVLGQGDRRFELGLHQSFKSDSEEELRAGYYIAAQWDGQLDLNTLQVHEGRLVRANDPTVPVREFDYLLFRLETSGTRDDLDGLAEISTSIAEAEDAAQRDDMEEARSWLRKAKMSAWRSPDLTKADRKRLPGAIEAQFVDFLKVHGLAGDGAGVDASSATLSERVAATPASDALTVDDVEVLAQVLA